MMLVYKTVCHPPISEIRESFKEVHQTQTISTIALGKLQTITFIFSYCLQPKRTL